MPDSIFSPQQVFSIDALTAPNGNAQAPGSYSYFSGYAPMGSYDQNYGAGGYNYNLNWFNDTPSANGYGAGGFAMPNAPWFPDATVPTFNSSIGGAPSMDLGYAFNPWGQTPDTSGQAIGGGGLTVPQDTTTLGAPGTQMGVATDASGNIGHYDADGTFHIDQRAPIDPNTTIPPLQILSQARIPPVLPVNMGVWETLGANLILNQGLGLGGAGGTLGGLVNRIGDIIQDPWGNISSIPSNITSQISNGVTNLNNSVSNILWPSSTNSQPTNNTSSAQTQTVLDTSGMGSDITLFPTNTQNNNGTVLETSGVGSDVTLFPSNSETRVQTENTSTQTVFTNTFRTENTTTNQTTQLAPTYSPTENTSTQTAVTNTFRTENTNTQNTVLTYNTINETSSSSNTVITSTATATNTANTFQATNLIPIPTTMPTTPVIGNGPQRDYYQEGLLGINALNSLTPNLTNVYGNASRAYGMADYRNFGDILAQYGITNAGLGAIANNQTVTSNTALRTGNVQDAAALGGQALGILQNLNPNQYAALNQAQARAGQDYGLARAGALLGTMGPSDTQKLLEKQTSDNLALGGQLSAQDLNQAQQAAREAWGARGLINSKGAIGAEILNTDALARQRLAERQQAAAAVDATGFAQRQQGYANALGYSGANNASYGNVLQNAALQTQSAFNPFNTITSANTQNQGTNAALYGQIGGLSSGQMGNQLAQQQYFPWTTYAGDVYGTNVNAQLARDISNANNAAAIQGANTQGNASMLSSVVNGLFGLYRSQPALAGGK